MQNRELLDISIPSFHRSRSLRPLDSEGIFQGLDHLERFEGTKRLARMVLE
jgi:hypothetical protein